MLNAAIVATAEEVKRNPILPEFYDIFYSAICFVVILFFFWKRVLPKVQIMLDERSAAIEGNIAKADQAQAEAEAALQEYTAQLAGARAEAGSIREGARSDAAAIVAEAKETASSEASRIQATAKAQIEAERQGAMISLRKDVGSLAVDLASSVVAESLKDDQKSLQLVDRFLADLEASESKKVK